MLAVVHTSLRHSNFIIIFFVSINVSYLTHTQNSAISSTVTLLSLTQAESANPETKDRYATCLTRRARRGSKGTRESSLTGMLYNGCGLSRRGLMKVLPTCCPVASVEPKLRSPFVLLC